MVEWADEVFGFFFSTGISVAGIDVESIDKVNCKTEARKLETVHEKSGFHICNM